MTIIRNRSTGAVTTESQYRAANRGTSFPDAINWDAEGFDVVFPTPQPAYDPITRAVREIAPVLTVKGTFEQAWEVVALDAETVTANQAAQAAREAAALAANVDALWRAADAYTSGYISGVAIGLLTIGVMQSKPKALAVQAWSAAVWDDYYARKSAATAISAPNLDFSVHGPMPYSVPELRAELGM